MDDWVWWMIAAGVFAIGEIATLGFFLGPIAIAAVTAAIVALVGGGLAAQWIVFIAVSLASLLVLRPIARRHLRTPTQLRTGTAALVGRPGGGARAGRPRRRAGQARGRGLVGAFLR